MANGRLLACPSCARHVRSTETACPFCATALTASPAGGEPVPAARVASKRLSRAALFALGATAAAAVACSSTTDSNTVAIYGGPPADSGSEAEPTPMPVYGGPAIDAGMDAPVLLDAAYGGPPFDAADAADDADSGGAAPAYGAPP
jgi:hypothetical protein